MASTRVTRAPSSTSRMASVLPMKPSPPVMRTSAPSKPGICMAIIAGWSGTLAGPFGCCPESDDNRGVRRRISVHCPGARRAHAGRPPRARRPLLPLTAAAAARCARAGGDAVAPPRGSGASPDPRRRAPHADGRGARRGDGAVLVRGDRAALRGEDVPAGDFLGGVAACARKPPGRVAPRLAAHASRCRRLPAPPRTVVPSPPPHRRVLWRGGGPARVGLWACAALAELRAPLRGLRAGLAAPARVLAARRALP